MSKSSSKQNSERNDVPGNAVKGQVAVILIGQEASDDESRSSETLTAETLHQSCQLNVKILKVKWPNLFPSNIKLSIFF